MWTSVGVGDGVQRSEPMEWSGTQRSRGRWWFPGSWAVFGSLQSSSVVSCLGGGAGLVTGGSGQRRKKTTEEVLYFQPMSHSEMNSLRPKGWEGFMGRG